MEIEQCQDVVKYAIKDFRSVITSATPIVKRNASGDPIFKRSEPCVTDA